MRKSVLPIGHLSARIRAILSIEEEEALLGRIRIRRPVEKDDKKKAGRWSRPASFDMPGPFSERPLSPSGTTSFHFSIVPVSRAVDGSLILSVDGQKRLSLDALAKHDEYISRPDAVEALNPGDFDRYLNRDSAVATDGDVGRALFTNIDPDPAVRASYWNAVNRCERKAGPDKLILTPGRLSRASWQNIANLKDLPEAVREVAAEFSVKSKPGPTRKIQAIELPAAEAKAVIQLVKDSGEKWPVKAPPLRIAKGRGGRVQYRITTEFPAMLDAGARVRIAQTFCEELGAVGIMYVAAIHEPDYHNDGRNYHLHVAMHDRPAKRIGDLWDFEISRAKTGQYNRREFPYRQNKIPDFARDPEGGGHRLYGSMMTKALRERFADICNEEVAAAGSTRFFDPRTFEEMGIDRKPTAPLGTRAAPLEAAGIATRRGTENAEIIWSAAFADARREAERRSDERRKFMKRLTGAISASKQGAELAQLAKEFDEKASMLDQAEGELLIYDVSVKMARARPDRTIETCDRLLAAIRDGKASRSESKAKSRIEKRAREAKRFLHELDVARQTNGPGIEHIRRNTATIRARLAAIVEMATPLLERGHERAPEKAVPAAETNASPPKPVAVDRGLAHRLLDRVLRDNLHVLPPDEDQPFYRVPGVTRDELRALKDPAVIQVAQKRLAEIFHIQLKRIHDAADAVAKVGQHQLELYASQNGVFSRVLSDVRTYQNHPVFIARLNEAQGISDRTRADTSERQEGARLGRLVGALDSMAQQIGKFRKVRERAETEPSTEEVAASVTASSSIDAMPSRPNADRAEAVQRLANAIRTDRSLKVFMEHGTLQIDASSSPQWAASAHAFDTEEVVIAAVRQRHASPWIDCDAEEISRIIETVEVALKEMPTRPVERRGGSYKLICPTSEITETAELWNGFDRMQSALMRVHLIWQAIEEKPAKAHEAIVPAGVVFPSIGTDLEANSVVQERSVQPSVTSEPSEIDIFNAWRADKDPKGI